jgi:Na+/melibiose symporter-like transporter
MAAVIVFGSILISALATHRYIAGLWRAPERRQSFAESLREVFAVLTNPSLVVVMGAGLFSGVAGGIAATLAAFMSYYFWGLTPQILGALTLFIAPSFLIAVVLAPVISRAFDKKWTMIGVFALSIFSGVIPISLRLLGLLPPNGSPWIPIILTVEGFISQALALTGFIIVGSMIADVAEDNAVKTGVRSEGLLFAASNLLPKFTAGIGGFIGNFMLDLAHFPAGAQTSVVDYVDPAIMRHLALLSLPAGIVLNLAALSLLFFYRLDRGSHEANLEALQVAAALTEPPTALPVGGPALTEPGGP